MSKARAYEDLAVGDIFPEKPALYDVTADAIRSYRQIASTSLEGGGEKMDVSTAPATLAAVYIRGAQDALRNPPGGIHAKQGFRFHVPVHVGDTLSTLLEVKRKYEKKGRRYVVGETTTRNQAGAVVTTGEITFIWGRE